MNVALRVTGVIKDWTQVISAVTAILAVLGGMLGVYTSTQSRVDVAEHRISQTTKVLEQLALSHSKLRSEVTSFQERLVRNEVSSSYLKEGQDRLGKSMTELANEIKILNKNLSNKE